MEAFEAWVTAKGAVVAADERATRRAVPLELMLGGNVVLGAQLVDFGRAAPLEHACGLGVRLIDELKAGGVAAVYGVAGPEWPVEALDAMGMKPIAEVALRSFYLSLGVLGDVFEERGPHPFRRAAAFARRLRQKLVEVSFDDGWLDSLARLSKETDEVSSFAVHRTKEYLSWRYRDAPDRRYRLLVLRRNAGAGIDGYAVVEPFEPEPKTLGIRVIDHWARSAERVGDRRFMIELALWCLAEQAAVVEALGVHGSSLDGLFRRTGGFTKPWSGQLFWRSIDPQAPIPSADRIALRAGDLLDY